MKIALFLLSAGAVAALTYLATTFVQVVFHRWFGHEDRLHEVFVNHARGHHADYRAGRLRSECYVEAERHVLWYYALPLVPLTARFAWFRRKRELHLRHHVRQDANYAIVAFFWDRLLGTLDRQPAEARRH